MLTNEEALRVLAQHRGERVVITTMTATGIWPRFSDTPLDFAYIPSAMGHGLPLGIGLALAQPARGVIVVNGDGSLLMNLGSLVTLASSKANVFVLLMDNGLYEVTGGQPVAGAGAIDFAALARSVGIARVYAFDDAAAWELGAAEALAGSGPVVVWLKIEGRLGQKTPKPPRPMSEQLARLREGLGLP